MRITGLATGLDIDDIIKNSMKPYRVKIDQTTQSKDVVEIKQKLYRDIISDASKFYDKYFDILKSDNLLNSKNYTSVKFTSNSSAVTVTGNSIAKNGNYTIEGTSATASKAVVTIDKFTDVKENGIDYKQITINGKDFKVALNKDKTKMAADLNNQLKEEKINVKVRYSDMAGTEFGNTSGFIFESTILGSQSGFTIGKEEAAIVLGAGSTTQGTNAKVTGISLDDVKNGNFLIGDSIIKIEFKEGENEDKSLLIEKLNEKLIEYNFTAKTDELDNITLVSNTCDSKVKNINVKVLKDTTFTKEDGSGQGMITGISLNDVKNGNVLIGDNRIKIEFSDSEKENEEIIINKFNEKLKEYNISAKIDDLKNITLKSNGESTDIDDLKVKVVDESKIISTREATKSTVKVNFDELKSAMDGMSTFTIDGNVLNLNLNYLDEDIDAVTYLNSVFELNNIDITAKVAEEGGILFESKDNGIDSKFDIKILIGANKSQSGADSSVKIKDDKGGVYTVNNEEFSNGVEIDGITFKFNGKIPSEGVAIDGKTDVKEIKEKLVNFINDYNTLIEKLNSLISTKHDRSYTPLTADQKKEMTEDEIKLWNERVEKGQLYKDSDLTRITDSMKDIMKTFMEDSGLNLEQIGILPVKDYSSSKNGTFTIDESKLTKALEEDIERVMNLFTRPAPEKPTDNELKNMTEDQIEVYKKAKNQTGILFKLKDTLYNEFKTSLSSLSKKVGISGTSSFTNNELTKSISNYETKIKDMENDFSRREQALYSKYATLETMMNKLNSQQSNLLSQLGMSQS